MPIVSEKAANYSLELPARHVRLLRNGANQAVRTPKEFELAGTDALLHREGNRLILELLAEKPAKGTMAALALDHVGRQTVFARHQRYL